MSPVGFLEKGAAVAGPRRVTLLGLAPLLGLALLAACASPGGGNHQQAQTALIEQAWGIRVLRVSLVAGGGLIDVRYQVVNPEKAAIALGGGAGGHGTIDAEDIKDSPLLIDEATGFALTEARLHLSGRAQAQRLSPKAGLERFILFTNTGGLVNRGDKVSLAIRDLRWADLVIQ